MALILNKSDQVVFHTDLRTVTKPFREEIAKLNWQLTNQDYILLDYNEKGLVEELDHESDKIIFSGSRLIEIIDNWQIQFLWGVFCGVKGNIPNLRKEELPFADCNREIWTEPDRFFLDNSEIEIICFDGTDTILKFRDKEIEKEFQKVFPEAKEVEKLVES